MKDFLNGFTLLFNPFAAKDLFFETPKIGIGHYFENTLAHLSKSYYAETKKTNPKKK